MNIQLDKQMDRLIGKWINGQVDIYVNMCMDGWMINGWIDREMDGQNTVWRMDVFIFR